MHNNDRSSWAILALFITTALVPAQKALGNTEALWKAVTRGDEASVKALLNQGADPNSKVESHTILMLPAYNGHLEVVKKIIKANADVNE